MQIEHSIVKKRTYTKRARATYNLLRDLTRTKCWKDSSSFIGLQLFLKQFKISRVPVIIV